MWYLRPTTTGVLTSRASKKDGIIRSSKIKHAPRCMLDEALRHVLALCKYHMERNPNNYKLITVGAIDDNLNRDWNH